MVYDLEERTLKFSENIIKIIKTIDNNYLTQPIVNQLIRSATSLEQIIVKQIMPVLKRTLEIKYLFVKKKQMKQNIG